MILVDTSGLLAALFPDQTHHQECATVLAGDGPFVLSPFVLAELDHLVGCFAGFDARQALLEEVVAGAYDLAPYDATDVAEAASIGSQYEDLDVGLADASIVVLARRSGTIDLLSLDQRHFRVLKGPDDRPFRILPFDA
mgnify:CR=1 FL=1